MVDDDDAADKGVNSYDWPTASEGLFDAEPSSHIAVGWVAQSREWEGYTTGYQLAGRTLVESVLAQNFHQDFLVYPILFCYRHAAEIRMKQLLVLVGKVLRQDVSVPGHHQLLPLWDALKNLIVQVWPLSEDGNASTKGVAGITKWLKDLARVDERSYAFRYPETPSTKSRPAGVSIDPSIEYIDMLAFAKRMERMLNIFGSWEMGLSVELENRDEAARLNTEMRWEYEREMREDADRYRWEMQGEFRAEYDASWY